MDYILVRYGEIGTKSNFVRDQMHSVLRQRVEDRLKYEGIEYEKVSKRPGRVIVELSEAENAAEKLAELPGVSSVSPAIKTGADIEEMKTASESFEYGETFGVDARRSGEHDFSSRDVQVELGSHIEDFTGASVDLDDPDTLLEVEVRDEEAYIFTERIEGPDGLPVGTQDELLTLISGGIDSPVAAHEVMKRGSDILPIYFYNRPVAAEDHWLRFRSVVERLKRFNPSKDWNVYKVDMEAVNEELMKVERGRMVLHRIIIFRAAEKIADSEGIKGIVTGESMGQKSSQTASNLSMTTKVVDKPVIRPLITHNKNEIVEKAKDIGTFKDAQIASACSTMAPDSPATSIQESDLDGLKEKVDIDALVERALEGSEKITL